MKEIKNKTTAILITAILMMSVGVSTTLLQGASAHNPPLNIPTYAFCNVGTNPTGVGQTVTIGMWLGQPPPTANGPYGDRWQNITLKITLPDGTTKTQGPFTSDDTGGTYTSFTPDTLGTYTFQTIFGGQKLVGDNPTPGTTSPFIGDYYEPSNSSVATLTVQQEPVGGVSVAPLPTEYWQTPINAMNVHNWYAISGASLNLGGAGKYNTTSNFNPFTTAPKSAHILWTQPEAFGGVLGGAFGGTTTYGNYYSTAQYEKKFAPVIINGYLYYNVYPGSSTTPTGIICVDLYTGETVWTDNGANYGGGSPVQTALTSSGLATTLLCGQILDYVSPNQYGGLAYLWTTGTPAGIVSTGTTLNMFDARTGTYILSVVNGTTPAFTTDESGNLIGYYINQTAGKQQIMGNINNNIGPSPTIDVQTGPTLNKWNSTTCIMASAWAPTASGWQWRPPQLGIIPFSNGLMWRAPLATNYSGNALPSAFSIGAAGPITSAQDINSGVVMMTSGGSSGGLFQPGWQIEAGYSADTGQQLWIENRTYAPYSRVVGECDGNGVYCEISYEDSTLYGYNVHTGDQLWKDVLSPVNPYDSIGGYMSTLANGTLYLAGFGGDIWSINMLTGSINWYTNTTTLQGPSGTNSPYGVWPIWTFSIGAVADGVLFLEEGHEYSPPLFLGAQQLAINCSTGQLVWSINAFDVDSIPAIAYGVMTVINAYDNQIYAYGMGPSKVTVNAPNVGVTTQTPITITGTITDISAGASQDAVAKNYPNGLPCVSDDSMSSFMESVYMQQPVPTNTTGVLVTISVMDSNGNYRTIGTTTSNALGVYSLTWTPDIAGDYTVYATFAGSNSYYGSQASTAFYAQEAAPTTTPQAAQGPSIADQFFLPMSVVIIIAIVAVGAAILLAQRKKP
jgi:FOG: WD40-like repeat